MSEKMITLPLDLVSQAATRLANLNQPTLASALRGWTQNTSLGAILPRADEQASTMAEKYPAYWKPIPQHWQAIDTYRIDDLFPLDSSRLYHARKKLLVPGCRTGGKSVYDDIKEAHATLGAWLADNKPE